MKNYVKNLAAIGFLALFLPYTITLLLDGRQGIHQEHDWPELEYRVMERMTQEDLSWMDDDLLELMAVICRTGCAAEPEGQIEKRDYAYTSAESGYERLLQAVQETRGRAVRIDGEYRELPYHAVSAGSTRSGSLLGEGYGYLVPVECPEDLEAQSYLQVCTLTQRELEEALGCVAPPEGFEMERDAQGYVTWVKNGESEWAGESFRTLLHLNSSCFWIEEVEGGLQITVKGSGHGFGVSLYTASRMFQEGASMEDILEKFYQNAECITIP